MPQPPPIQKRLRRHPANRQHLHLELVVVLGILLLVLGNQIDTDLDRQIVGHENVARGQVLENEVLRGQVLHAAGDLLPDVEEVGHGALLLLRIQVVGADAAEAGADCGEVGLGAHHAVVDGGRGD